jgi:diguanylate cyclase (GGDEF)-like protein/PAS domain S-box-containing protein
MALNGSGSVPGRDSPSVARLDFDRARVAHLYRTAIGAYFASPVYVALLALVLWDANTADALAGWMAAAAGVVAARYAIHRAYLRSRDPDPWAWESRFALGALAAGAVWSVAPLVFFPTSTVVGQLAIIFVGGGALIGAAGLYAASRSAFLGFCALPMVATVYALGAQSDFAYRAMAGMLVLFAFILYLVYSQLRRSVLSALRIQLENEALARQLAASESRMRDAIDSSPDGIAVFDGDDRLVVCNAEYAALYAPGLSPESLAGTPFRRIAEAAFDTAEAVPEGRARDREGWIRWRIEGHLSGGGALRQFRTRDGRWMQGKSVRTPLGGIVGVFTDISETKRAEAAYRAVLAEENLIFDILPVGIAFVEDRAIVRCNRRLERMLGYGPGELVGQPTRLLYRSAEAWDAVGKDTYGRLSEGGIVEYDVQLVRKDGSLTWCRSFGRAVDAGNPQASAIFAFADAQESRAAERALRDSEEMYRNLVETSNDLIWSLDLEGRWTYLNGAAVRRIWGGEAAEMLGQPFHASLEGAVRERDCAVFGRVFEGQPLHNYETRHLRRDGTPVDLSYNAIPLRNPAGDIVGATGTARDVTDLRLAAAALFENVERLRLAVDAADLYYWEWGVQSDAFTWGCDPSGLLGVLPEGGESGADIRKLIHPDDRARYESACVSMVETGEPHLCEFRIVARGGEVRWVAARGQLVYAADGAPERVIGVSQDVTERKRQEDEVRYLAYHDTLTGLPNRRLLDDRLRQAVFAAQRRAARMAVMAIDLDHFKSVNDTLGHKAGDAVLREVASRLTGCVRKADTLARQGGDEFVIVIPDLAHEADCVVVAEKILRTLGPEILVDGRAFSIGASIGISLFPADAGDGETLLRNADAAMYRAKELGRNTYRFYGR